MCKIIREIKFEELEKKINASLKAGYKVSGGITTQNIISANGRDTTLYIVLMIKEDKEKK